MPIRTIQNLDFVTREQRIQFISRIIPLVDFAFALLITLKSEHKLAVMGLAIINPMLTVFLFNSGFRSRFESQFNLVAVGSNTITIFLIGLVAGSSAPVYLLGITFIGACTMVFVDFCLVIPVVVGMLTAIVSAMWVTDRSFTDMLMVTSILLCFTLLMSKIVQFTMFHGLVVVKATNKIIAQKQLIEDRNKDITDSINYAYRIQRAELPTKESIFNALPDTMLLFKPKDIVSGDFYFFKENRELIYLAAADCTGHGVPGAFMSLIGMERLSDAVDQFENPSEILWQLNQSLATSMKTSGSKSYSHDGMDIALCVIDKNRKLIHYAGANRPFWIIRSGRAELEEVKASKCGIHGEEIDKHTFVTHTIPYQHGDCFYMFSDGFADSFSGDTGKKLTTKRFKELLLNLRDKTMHQQQHYLNHFIENWRSGEEQTDDILVIGFKIPE